jgi:hypothetical protein
MYVQTFFLNSVWNIQKAPAAPPLHSGGMSEEQRLASADVSSLLAPPKALAFQHNSTN